MLGTLAFQDADGAYIETIRGATALEGLSKDIADTAVDVFVYDTRKDSDGGAWRKRTQHTSWYNETLNTATRGSRRDFPAVAVIVAESNPNKVTIYDGDDPNLPMWMVFNASNSESANFMTVNGQTLSSIFILNGDLCVGFPSANGWGINRIKFVSDSQEWYWTSPYIYYQKSNSIAERNVENGYFAGPAWNSLRNARVNDVAMTVLPNAPIDSTTGLPIPTIAVACGTAGSANGGVSIIKDDGTVIDIIAGTGAGGYASYNVEFGSNNELIHTQAYNRAYSSINIFDNIPSSDISGTSTYTDARSYPYINSVPNIRGGVNGAETPYLHYVSNSSGDNIAFGFKSTNAKLSLLSDNKTVGTDATKSMVAYIASDYNTGWMHGDIKGAFLSDTDATNVTGTELHPNGNSDFSSTDVSYISNTASGTATVTSGQLVLSGGTSSYSDHILTVSNLEVGAQYIITIDYVSKSAGAGSIGFYVNGSYLPEVNDGYGYVGRSTGQSYSFYFTTQFSSRTIDLVTGGGTSETHTFDNWSIKKVEPDRSVNNKGLQVFGTIAKSAVAPGAELVGYSGFSASNHLRQPPNSNMNIGTGDAHEMIWFKTTSTSGTMMLISYEGGANGTTDYGKPFNIRYTNGVVHGWASHDGFNTDDNVTHGVSTADGTWHHAAWIKRGQVFELYVDGKFIGSDTGGVGTNALSDPNSELVIGGRKRGRAPGTCEEPFVGSLALARIGKSAPSAEQIKKIYEDEKFLFQETAACTLYGSSDTVTALAYDDTASLLHVGTSSGRSEFKGLRRVGNTTTAVTTAISASNGLVAEQ
jgi:hypothetical protein